jgi:hypothetical protein
MAFFYQTIERPLPSVQRGFLALQPNVGFGILFCNFMLLIATICVTAASSRPSVQSCLICGTALVRVQASTMKVFRIIITKTYNRIPLSGLKGRGISMWRGIGHQR